MCASSLSCNRHFFHFLRRFLVSSVPRICLWLVVKSVTSVTDCRSISIRILQSCATFLPSFPSCPLGVVVGSVPLVWKATGSSSTRYFVQVNVAFLFVMPNSDRVTRSNSCTTSQSVSGVG